MRRDTRKVWTAHDSSHFLSTQDTQIEWRRPERACQADLVPVSLLCTGVRGCSKPPCWTRQSRNLCARCTKCSDRLTACSLDQTTEGRQKQHYVRRSRRSRGASRNGCQYQLDRRAQCSRLSSLVQLYTMNMSQTLGNGTPAASLFSSASGKKSKHANHNIPQHKTLCQELNAGLDESILSPMCQPI